MQAPGRGFKRLATIAAMLNTNQIYYRQGSLLQSLLVQLNLE